MIRLSVLAFYTCQLARVVLEKKKLVAMVTETWCPEDGKTGR